MSTFDLKFLKNEAGENEGLSDAGIETFSDSPYASCAREAGQNSRDAAEQTPVKMTFNVLSLNRNEIPSCNLLEEALSACKKESTQDREKEFFSNAMQVIQKKKVSVLEIADYHTTGLKGPPNKEGTPFHSLVKGSGVTTKAKSDSGGSFGIGKSASFAVSDLHAVFYATSWKDSGSHEISFATQGKIKLVSHRGKDGTKLRATGYWGDANGYQAITDRKLVPDWLNRNEIGTSVFCIGFRTADDWAERMTYSLVTNFFCAIHREEMVFEVDAGKIKINVNTLEELLTDSNIVQAAERAGHHTDILFAQQLFRCLVSDIAKEHLFSIPNLGKVRVRVLIQEGLPRRIGFIRNGMLITDNLKHFGQPLVRFPGSRDFVALVEPADSKTSAFLKKLENPSHDGFSAERISDATKRLEANKAMKALGTALREFIKDATGVKHDGAVVLDELGNYFGDSPNRDSASTANEEPDPERYTYKPSRKNKNKDFDSTRNEFGNRGGSSNAGKNSTGNKGSKGGGTGSGSGGKGKLGTRESITLYDVRNRIQHNDATSREIHFTSKSDGKVELKVEATGIDRPENLSIRNTNKGTVSSGAILLELTPSQRQSLTVIFDEAYEGPIEVKAYTLKEKEELVK